MPDRAARARNFWSSGSRQGAGRRPRRNVLDGGAVGGEARRRPAGRDQFRIAEHPRQFLQGGGVGKTTQPAARAASGAAPGYRGK